MGDRASVKAVVTSLLGDRELVWAGLRGEDIEPIVDLPQLTASFSIIGAYGRRGSVEGLAYESLSGRRPDLEVWDIEDHLDDPSTVEFRQQILRSLSRPSALLPYRPSSFLSALRFARGDRCLGLGLFGAHQAAFEHKPWVETGLRGLGVPSVPWSYVADEDQFATLRELRAGPIVLRRSRTSGGEGFERVDDPDQLMYRWPKTSEGFVSVAPYLDDVVPVNVGATAWVDGVTVHYPSIQLIGDSCCVTRPFGYFGNDFGAAQTLDTSVIMQIEDTTKVVGDWLIRHGYRGTFGVDYLVRDGRALFMEVNPRFQGSSTPSARLSIHDGEACLFLEHIAAMLGQPCPPQRALVEMVRGVQQLSNVVIHWLAAPSAAIDCSGLVAEAGSLYDNAHFDVVAPSSVQTEVGGVVCRLTVDASVVGADLQIDRSLRKVIDQWQRSSSAVDTEQSTIAQGAGIA